MPPPIFKNRGWLCFFRHECLILEGMFDIIIITIAVFAFVSGFRRGLIGELAGLVALALGLYGAARFCPQTEELISPYLAGTPTSLIAFAVTLVVIVILVHFVSSLATRFLSMVALSIPNKILGGAFSVVKVLLVVSCVIGLANRLWPGDGGIFSEEQKKEMVTYKYIEPISSYVFPYIDKCVEAVREAGEAIDKQQ